MEKLSPPCRGPLSHLFVAYIGERYGAMDFATATLAILGCLTSPAAPRQATGEWLSGWNSEFLPKYLKEIIVLHEFSSIAQP